MSRFSSKMLPDKFKEIFVFSRFFVVGAIGFTIDFTVLSFCMHAFDMSPIWSRIPSSITAILSTWFLNMTFTFRANPKSRKKSLLYYAIVKWTGFLINFAIYTTLLLYEPFFYEYPFFALAISAGIAMFYNFFLSRKVFEKI